MTINSSTTHIAPSIDYTDHQHENHATAFDENLLKQAEASGLGEHQTVEDYQTENRTRAQAEPDPDLENAVFYDAEEGPDDEEKAIADNAAPASTWGLFEPFNALTGAITGAVTNTFDAANGLIGRVYDGGHATAERLTGATAAQPVNIAPPRADKHLELAEALSMRIDRKLRGLNQYVAEQLQITIMPQEEGRIDAPALTGWEKLGRYGAQVRGYVTAAADTAETTANGGIVAGIGMTGLLGLGGMLGGLSFGAGRTIQSARSLAERANLHAVTNEIDRVVADVETDLKELESLLTQEDQRQQASERLMAGLIMGTIYCQTLDRAIKETEAALSPQALPAAAGNTHGSESSTLSRARDALYAMLGSLIKNFQLVTSWIIPSAATSAPQDFALADKNAEAAFRKAHEGMLASLAQPAKDSNIKGAVHVMAHKTLMDAGGPADITVRALLADIRAGENLTRQILSSELNFGEVLHIRKVGDEVRHDVVPSDLVTARAIARFIEAQSLSNQNNPTDQANGPVVSKREDGAYVIRDPERKLYRFLANAPTAYANFLTLPKEQKLESLTDLNMERMTIADHSHGMPGGAAKMEFETEVDKQGSRNLVIRFDKEDNAPTLRPDRARIQSLIEESQRAFHLGKEDTMLPVSDKAMNFSHMTPTELLAHRSKLINALEQQVELLQDNGRHYEALKQWNNPKFKRA
ncbi:hypothetical protein [Bordetella sp. 15P40C-2]|uniref:hypothetical protein n=1 Tax=Bordetella sp. 15P40C-2 TaxID=2572246 RepID=UPI001328DA2C|nr:hypothetical protein [Bordetella sp. 15P40C-2]MVW70453.1 hypothetical protein [Bordetella sp. 15P40C-2]